MPHNFSAAALTVAMALCTASCATYRDPVRTDRFQPDWPLRTPSGHPNQAPPLEVQAALRTVSPAQVRADVDAMVAFGTRHTESDTTSPTRGIGAARRWVADQFVADITGARPMSVGLIGYTQEAGGRITKTTEIVNVVATLPGRLPDNMRQQIYVLGHLDSRNSDGADSVGDAPGANDDASGVAVLLAIARALRDVPLDHTIILAATSGEEQGLYGAAELARRARAENAPIRAILNNDIVGDPVGNKDPDSSAARIARQAIRVFSVGVPPDTDSAELARISTLGAESDSPAREVARYMAEVASLHTLAVRPMLVFRNDRFLRGGDHTAFQREGFDMGVRLTAPWEDYNRQHQDVRTETDPATGRTIQYGDLPEFVDAEYLAGVAQLNLATAMHLASAPTAPADVRIVTAELMNDTLLRWSPSPELDVAGYEVVTRQTTSAVWTDTIDVGAVTEARIPLSKDNLLFGVRAYDRDGYRSLVTFAGSAKE